MGLDLEITILLVGLNHKTAPVEIREKLSFKDSSVFPLEKLKNEGLSFKEAYFLSTCNRVEFCFVLEKSQKDFFLSELFSFFEKEVKVTQKELKKYFYQLENDEAVKHLFEVACGLDSLVLGEPQILGQVKEAYQKALFHKTSGIVLNRLLHRCFFVAKRVRTETGIGGGAVSISYAACELAKKILGSLKQKVVLLVGAGEMAELACMHFISAGIKKVLIANRTISKAVELADRFKGEAYSLEELPYVLTKADVVISSTGAPSFVITKKMVASILKLRKFRPLFIIDIAVPRDVEPEVNQLENVYVYNIDDLKEVVEENFQERKKEALRAKVIIEEEVFKFKKWLKQMELHPTIKALSEKMEQLRKNELAKTLKKLKNLSEEEKQHLEVLTQSLVQKIIYYPIKFIKKDHHEKGSKAIGIIRQMFELDSLETETQFKQPENLENSDQTEKELPKREEKQPIDPSMKKVLLQ